MKHAFEETIITTFEENEMLNLYVVTDKPDGFKADLQLEIIDFDGNIMWEEIELIDIKANSSQLIKQLKLSELIGLADPSKLVMVSRLKTDESLIYEDLHYFRDPKDLQLVSSDVVIDIHEKGGYFEIKLSSEKLAKNVFLSTDISNAHFSDNYFDLLPGKERMITFPKTTDLRTFKSKLKVVHLY